MRVKQPVLAPQTCAANVSAAFGNRKRGAVPGFLKPWSRRWSAASWRSFLEEGETESELDALRRCTHTGRPFGSAKFVGALEHATERRLSPGKGGRPRKAISDPRQEEFMFPKRTRQAAEERAKTGKKPV